MVVGSHHPPHSSNYAKDDATAKEAFHHPNLTLVDHHNESSGSSNPPCRQDRLQAQDSVKGGHFYINRQDAAVRIDGSFFVTGDADGSCNARTAARTLARLDRPPRH